MGNLKHCSITLVKERPIKKSPLYNQFRCIDLYFFMCKFLKMVEWTSNLLQILIADMCIEFSGSAATMAL
jgi:hypothetical protein